jgi:hypothetical protein
VVREKLPVLVKSVVEHSVKHRNGMGRAREKQQILN